MGNQLLTFWEHASFIQFILGNHIFATYILGEHF